MNENATPTLEEARDSVVSFKDAIVQATGEGIPDESESDPIIDIKKLDEEIESNIKMINEEYSYLELLNERKTVKATLDGLPNILEDSKSNARMLSANVYELAHNIDDPISKANYDESVKSLKSLEEFIENYPALVERSQKVLDAIDDKIAEIETEDMTTSFMSKHITQFLNKQIKSTEEKDASFFRGEDNKKKTLLFYSNKLAAIEDRENTSWLINEMKKYAKDIVRIARKLGYYTKNRSREIEDSYDAMMINFGKLLNAEVEKSVRALFLAALATTNNYKGVFEENGNAAIQLVMYMISSIYTKENNKGYGNGDRVMTLIVNLIDIANGKYDLPKGKDEYIKEVGKLMDETFRIANMGK